LYGHWKNGAPNWKDYNARKDSTSRKQVGKNQSGHRLQVLLKPDCSGGTSGRGKSVRIFIDEIHRQISTAHPGRQKTKKLLRSRYYWPTWNYDVDRYLDNCLTCKRMKTTRDRTPGLLQPLPVPARPWQHISMDFCSFPRDRHGYDAVFTVVDRLSKRPISIPCHKTITAREMAQLFIVHVHRWKGAPETIVSDCGGQFISDFWNEFCRILGVKLKLSTSNHPQTDGQTEIWNQYMAQRLRPFVNYSFDWRAASTPRDLKIEQQEAQKMAERDAGCMELG